MKSAETIQPAAKIDADIKTDGKGETAAGQTNDGVPKAGTIQMAFPRYQVNQPPEYPVPARKRGLEGRVILRVLVSSTGVVDDLEIEASSGTRLLDRAAVATVEKWRFEPGRIAGKEVSMWVRVPITFKLQQ